MKRRILEIGKYAITSENYDMIYDTAKSVVTTSILEIGARYGCSSMILATVAKENNAKLYSIEMEPKIEWENNLREVGVLSHATLLPNASPWMNILSIPKDIDYFFIDGDHSTIGCLADYYYFSPMIRVGGLVAIHDTDNPLVMRAVDLIKEEHGLEEIARCDGELGLIVLRKNKLFDGVRYD